MRNLDAFSRRDDFLRFRGEIREFSIVQGILLDYHPYWVQLWNIRERAGPDSSERALRPWLYSSPVFVRAREYDPEWRPDAWRRYLIDTGRKDHLPPIYVILSIRPVGVPRGAQSSIRPTASIARDFPQL